MIAAELINRNLPVIHSKDKCSKVLDLMDEFKVNHLPVVDGNTYLGLISETFIQSLDDDTDKVEEHLESLVKPFVFEDQHLFDALKLIDAFKLNIVVVLDKNEKYLGAFETSSIVHAITNLNAVNQSGGILVLEMNPRDYSMTQLSQIIEGNDARILASYVTPQEGSSNIEVTLKINREDLSSIIQTLHRFNYIVKSMFHQSEYDEDMRRRFEVFMNYINM